MKIYWNKKKSIKIQELNYFHKVENLMHFKLNQKKD